MVSRSRLASRLARSCSETQLYSFVFFGGREVRISAENEFNAPRGYGFTRRNKSSASQTVEET
jgi:hypothetical protein